MDLVIFEVVCYLYFVGCVVECISIICIGICINVRTKVFWLVVCVIYALSGILERLKIIFKNRK